MAYYALLICKRKAGVMKLILILISSVVILPSNSLSFKSNMLEGNLKPYSQPLPAMTSYNVVEELPLARDNQFVGIDRIITGRPYSAE